MHKNNSGLALSHTHWLDDHHALKYSMRASLIDQLRFSTNEEVLEIGCGAGNWTFLISDYIDHEGHITAIDIDSESISIANNRQNLLAKKNITFEESEINHFLNEDNRQFDTIILFNTLSYLKTPQSTLNNLLKKLRSGGRIIIKDTDISSDLYWPICPEILGKVSTALLKAAKNNVKTGSYDPFFARKLPSILSSLGNVTIDTHSQAFTLIGSTTREEKYYIQQNASLVANILKTNASDNNLLANWKKIFFPSRITEKTIFDSIDFIYSMTEFIFEIKNKK
ncbi:hypothetical protein IMCC1989_1963 [gamma proteobacterium IMCC1989]|nr:hypothetical protein IMCC1989_1963 [gamma proteobacterium IMCC1989]